VVAIDGLRTPMGKAGGMLESLTAVDLGAVVLRELLSRAPMEFSRIDHLIIGNVIQPSDAANIARVIGLSTSLPRATPAYTVHRNCVSGMQALTDAALMIQSGRAEVVIAGGVESMTRAPLLFHDQFRVAMGDLAKAKRWPQKLAALRAIAQAPWKPRIALLEGLTDPTVGLNMGQTAEVLAREFAISRAAQDRFALESHRRAEAGWESGWYAEETMPLFVPPKYAPLRKDEGIRAGQSMQALAKLRPVFEKPLGTVTAGNSSQITDGAALLLLSHRELAEAEGWPILGYLHDWHYSGCDPKRMGLGPVYASHRLLHRNGLDMAQMARVEINEAFAAQVLACLAAFDSDRFAGDLGGAKLGAPEESKLNVHGGAVALGHPVGMSGARIVLTLLHQLKRQTGGGLGLATLCIGGGQGGAVLVGGQPWQC